MEKLLVARVLNVNLLPATVGVAPVALLVPWHREVWGCVSLMAAPAHKTSGLLIAEAELAVKAAPPTLGPGQPISALQVLLWEPAQACILGTAVRLAKLV